MAELRESILDPITLSDKINGLQKPKSVVIQSPVESNSLTSVPSMPEIPKELINQMPPEDSDSDVTDVPDAIDGIYTSVSVMMENMCNDITLLNRNVDKLCHTTALLKLENASMAETYESDIQSIKKRIADMTLLQRQIMDIRNSLTQSIDANIKSLKLSFETRIKALEDRLDTYVITH
jgi:hypothetical protein